MERTWRSTLADVGVVVATVAWALVLRNEAAAGNLQLPTGGRLAVDVAVAVVSVIAVVALRHRHPIAVAAALVPGSAVSLFAGVPVVVALFTATWRTTTWTVVGLAGAHVAAAMVHGVLFEPNPPSVSGVITLAAFHGAPVALGLGRRARLEHVAILEDRVEQAHDEQRRRVEEAQRTERQRIAREMHDVVAHRISAVSLHAGALSYRPDAPVEDIARAAEIIRSNAHAALTELRDVIKVLRESPDVATPERPQPTLDAVDGLLADARAAGMRILVDDRRDATRDVPVVIGRTAYRVVEEGITNAGKHAPNATVRITIDDGGEEGLRVELVNAAPIGRGSGIPGAGAGLIGLTERVGLTGGRIEHGRTDAGEFRLEVQLPWTT